MNDILPDASATWRYLESVVRDIVQSYGYAEVRLPLLEQTELFARSIGEVTDIVEKEMYTFLDRNGESLTLRPEATAGMVRAGITNGMLHNQRQKLWTSGPMFRYEKPQKGRYRQFYQFDVEALGFDGPGHGPQFFRLAFDFGQRLFELQIVGHRLLMLSSAASIWTGGGRDATTGWSGEGNPQTRRLRVREHRSHAANRSGHSTAKLQI